jgi:AraC family transcriptional regulator
MKVLIKNMVCDRCKYVIQTVLEEMELRPVSVNLGEVDFGSTVLDVEQLERLRDKIEPLGFELINDKKSRLIESVKKYVIAFVQHQDRPEKTKISDYLRDHLHRDYTYLSNLFSAVEGVTIEQYFINQKIEKTKEFLVYDELTLTEIAFRLGYSSVAHLSRQFKKVTGLTPSHFKRLKDSKQRKSIDKV